VAGRERDRLAAGPEPGASARVEPGGARDAARGEAPRRAGLRRPERLLLAALLVANFALRFAVLIRPIAFLDDLAIPDDAYLSLTLARNIAHGLGPRCGLTLTNGFQPLYVFLMAPVFALVPNDPETPIHVALALLSLFDTAALFLLFRLVARLSAARETPFLAALSWVVHPYAVLTALNALETSIAFFFLVALFLALARLEDTPRALDRARVTLGIGVLLGLAALARIDSLLLAPVIAGTYLARHGLAPPSWRPFLKACAVTAAGALVVYLPWLLYSWHWTHDLFPVSGRALRYLSLSAVEHRPTLENFYRPVFERAIGVVVRKNALYLGLLPPLFLGLAFLGPRVSGRDVLRRLSGLVPVLAFSALLFAAYVGVIFGPWHLARYLFPLTLALLLLFAALVDLCASAIPNGAARRGLAAAVLALVIAGSVVQPPFRRLFAPRFEGTWGYRRIGLWAQANFPAGAVVGGSQTGALAYFADRLVVVNLDGVVNRDCYDAMRRKRMLDYIREVGVRDLVWQDDIELIARESSRTRASAVTLVRRIEGFETWGAKWYLYRIEPS